MNESKYRLHWTTPLYLAKVRKHLSPYEVDVMGVSLVVHPGVMSPRYDWAGLFMIENLPIDLRGRRILEVGSGCGLVSVHALLRGAEEVVAVDINPAAVRNTLENVSRIGASTRAKVVHSDLFDEVQGQFDTIIFNAPYHGCEAADPLELGVADPDYRTLRRFFHQVSRYLRADGSLLFGFSESGDLELARSLIVHAGLMVTDEVSDTREGYQCMVLTLARASQGKT